MNVIVTSFNNGEVTPKIDTRSDVEKYSSSCRSLKNGLPLIYGCVTRRPALKYICNVVGTSTSFNYGLFGAGKFGE